MFGWLAQRTIGIYLCTFVLNNNALAILIVYLVADGTSWAREILFQNGGRPKVIIIPKKSAKENNNTRDRSPIASPERSSHVDDNVV